MKIETATRVDEWIVDCPECKELIELGSEVQAEEYEEEPVECDCGEKFLVALFKD